MNGRVVPWVHVARIRYTTPHTRYGRGFWNRARPVCRLWSSAYRVVATARAAATARWEGESFEDNDRFMLRAMDVTSAEDRDAVVSEVTERWGGVDILINNAGIFFRSVIELLAKKMSCSNSRPTISVQWS